MLTVLEFLFISHELSGLTFRSNIKILDSTQNFFIASNTLKNRYQLSAINSSTLVHVAIYRKQLIACDKLLRVRSPSKGVRTLGQINSMNLLQINAQFPDA